MVFSHGYAIAATVESFYASGKMTDGKFARQFIAAAVRDIRPHSSDAVLTFLCPYRSSLG